MSITLFFDANFGKWEDDTNTLATVKKLSVSPEDAPASRKTASRGSRRSNASRGSSRRSRAGSATTKIDIIYMIKHTKMVC